MRKIPKYVPIRAGSRQTADRHDFAMGFMAVILILTLIAGGVVALVLTGLFDPAQITNPLVETPEDRLNIAPPPTLPPSADSGPISSGLASVGISPLYQIASSSGRKSGVSAEQRQQIEQDVKSQNDDAYLSITDEWDVEGIVGSVKDVPTFFVPETSRITVKKTDLNPNLALPDEWVNILLLGTDDRDSKASDGRTDVMIIASIRPATGEIKLSSLARDIYLDIPMLNGQNRINVAHAYGGPNLVMKAVNTLFDMNITQYVRVNLHGLVDIISVFGGVEIELQPGEADQINYNVAVSEDYEGFGKDENRVPLKSDRVGLTKLDPLQALGYARVRHLDSDFGRTNRQRILMEKLLSMAMADASPQKMFLLANVFMPYLSTNLPMSEIVRIGASALVAGIKPIESLSIPIEGSYTYKQLDDASVLEINLKKNREELHKFIYGEYIPRTTK